jgi:hypothetical protein
MAEKEHFVFSDKKVNPTEELIFSILLPPHSCRPDDPELENRVRV